MLREAHPPLVLVMDDDPSIRRALNRLLRSAGLRVETFATAAELLTRKSPIRPVCLVLDVHLSDMNGLDVLRRIRVADPSLPMLIITGSSEPGLQEQAFAAGATAFLFKPFDDERLLEEVRRALLHQNAGFSEVASGLAEDLA